jgi:hypothetical protein
MDERIESRGDRTVVITIITGNRHVVMVGGSLAWDCCARGIQGCLI